MNEFLACLTTITQESFYLKKKHHYYQHPTKHLVKYWKLKN